MSIDIGSRARWLDEHSPMLFVAAGVLLVGYAGLNGLAAVTEATFDENLFQVGYVLGFLGLLGLYPRLVDHRPWLARTGAVLAVLGVVSFAAFSVVDVAVLMGLTAGGQPPAPLVVVGVAAFVVGYPVVGAAALRSDALSRTAGLALLVPGIIIVLMLAHMAAGLESPQTVFVVSAGQAMAHLAIGQSLRSDADAADREEAEAASDATARG